MKHIQRLIAGLTLVTAVAVSAAQDTGELRTILVNRTDEAHKAVGIVVGLITSGFTITITQSGGHLYERATGQAQFELFAESPTEFFLKMGDIQVTFVRDATGAVTHLVLLQNGLEHTARKVKSNDGGFSHE